MKILLYNAIDKGGAFAALTKFAEILSKDNHKVHIVTPWSGSFRNFIQVKIVRYFYKLMYAVLISKKTPTVVSTQLIRTGMGKFLDRQGADLIIFFWPSDSISLSEIARLKTKWVWRQSDNNLVLECEHFDERNAEIKLKLLKRIILNAKHSFARKFHRNIFGPSSKTCKPIEDLVGTEVKKILTPLNHEFYNQKLSKKIRTKNLISLGFVSNNGNDLLRKNWIDVEVLCRKLNENVPLKLIHMGGSSLPQSTLQIENLGYISNVEEKISNFYDRIDALIFLSQHDNSPQVVAEALARGVVIVCREAIGISEFVSNGQNGIVITDTSNPPILDILKLLRATTLTKRKMISKNELQLRDRIKIKESLRING